jgi:hypothetical protein
VDQAAIVQQAVAQLQECGWKSFGLIPHGSVRFRSVNFGSKLVAFIADWAVFADPSDS